MPDPQPEKKFLVAVREEGGKHQACLIDPETGQIDYVSPLMETREDALVDVHNEVFLRHAAKGEKIRIEAKRVGGEPEQP